MTKEQPSRDVFRKKYSEGIQKIYRRTFMPQFDFNKVVLQDQTHGHLFENYSNLEKNKFEFNSSLVDQH